MCRSSSASELGERPARSQRHRSRVAHGDVLAIACVAHIHGDTVGGCAEINGSSVGDKDLRSSRLAGSEWNSCVFHEDSSVTRAAVRGAGGVSHKADASFIGRLDGAVGASDGMNTPHVIDIASFEHQR